MIKRKLAKAEMTKQPLSFLNPDDKAITLNIRRECAGEKPWVKFA